MCGLSLVAASGVYSRAAVFGPLIVVASLVVEHGLQGAEGSVVMAQGLVAPWQHLGSSWTWD